MWYLECLHDLAVGFLYGMIILKSFNKWRLVCWVNWGLVWDPRRLKLLPFDNGLIELIKLVPVDEYLVDLIF